MKKRNLVLTIMLALMLVFSLCTTFAFADESETAAANTLETEVIEVESSAADEGAQDIATPPEDTLLIAEAPEDPGAEKEAEILAAEEAADVPSDTFTIGADEDAAEYDLSDGESAAAYVDGYADNLSSDPDFESHINTAIAKVRESIRSYATILSLLPPIIAIILALITKEVYSSLIIGIIAGGIIYAGGNFEGIINHVVQDGFIASVAESSNVGILIFLVILGTIVALMNKSGGSAAFGRWAVKHIKSRVGAQIATICLGVLIFIDDYFNCLTVGSVMRPVTDSHKVSRAKLAYLIDATAAPVCIIAPISSWAAAVAGFANSAGAESGIALFLKAIPYNFYALFTILMMFVLAIGKFDYGPMKLHERNAVEKGDLFTTRTKQAVEEMEASEKGRVIDLIIPVIFLIISCVIGMIYTGGFFGGTDFITAFSESDASVGLALGGAAALVFTVIYFVIRRTMKFRDIMESLPDGFKAMVPAILILVCAWSLKAMTDSLGAKIFISQLVEGSAGGFQMFLPAIIFAIAVGLSFATGTSWGTFGILIPIVLSVFDASNPLAIISISACMAGAVCGDHCSPISDTTIMSSAGAQCDHINHVSTQLPYALTIAATSCVSYIIAGVLAQTSGAGIIALPAGAVITVVTLIVIRAISGKSPEAPKAAAAPAEAAEASENASGE